MTTQDWIFRSLAVLLAILACGTIVFGLWGDRLRGRTKRCRCPKCWYDLEGAVPESDGRVLCSECGTRSMERALHSSRRRWWAIVPATALLLAGVLSWSWPSVDRNGWRAAVPTWAIVQFWPMDEIAWLENGAPSPMLEELNRRIIESDISLDALGLWAQRMAHAYAQDLKPGNAAPRSIYVGATGVALDMAPWLRLVCPGEAAGGVPYGRGNHRGTLQIQIADPQDGGSGSLVRWSDAVGDRRLTEHADRVYSLVICVVKPDGWAENGGSVARACPIGMHLLVVAPSETVDQCRTLIRALEQAGRASLMGQHSTPTPAGASEGRSIVIYNVADIPSHRAGVDMWAEERVDSVAARLFEGVDTDSWVENGGSDASAYEYSPFLIVSATPDIQARVSEYITHLRASDSP